MKTKTFALFVFVLTLGLFESGQAARLKKQILGSEDNSMDVTDFSIYYDINTNSTIRKMMPRPWYRPGWRLRLPFQGGKCDCDGLKCNCCSGVRIPQIGFDRQTCALITFEPNEGLLGLEVKMSNETVLKTSYTASNPPPYCIPIPVGGLPLNIFDMCIRFFDITVNWGKLHVCMDWDTRIDSTPVLILHFDCMNLGTGGVSISKPASTHQGPIDSDVPQLNADVFDPVTEIADLSTKSPIFNNSVKYI